MEAKRFLFLLKHPPQSGVINGELFDQVLTLAAFDQSVSVLFMEEGVYQLISRSGETDSAAEHAGRLAALAFYGIDSVWVESESLSRRGLSLDGSAIPVQAIRRESVAGLIARHDVILGD